MTRHLAIALIALALPLGACQNLTEGVVSLVATAKGPLPQQAKTLAEAEQLATVATDLTKTVVDTGKLSRAQLVQVSSYNDGVHSAVLSLEDANSKGQSLSFAAFNAALAAWNSYTATLPKP